MPRLFRSLLSPVLIALALLAVHSTRANNIQVAAAALTNNNNVAGTVDIVFQLSWENSWRGGSLNNWDAAWVFVKYRNASTNTWSHVLLSNTAHTVPPEASLDLGLLTPGTAYNATTNPCLGVFLRRSADGSGTFTVNAASLRWNYGAAGLNFVDIAEVRVLAVEMVYVLPGAFAAGSGGTGVNEFTLTTINTATASTLPAGIGSLGGQASGYPTGQTAPVATWPNGFNAFYIMKYELSQQAYVDFLNTLTYTQQVTRTASAPNAAAGTGALNATNSSRSGIDIQTPGVATTTPAVYACNLDGDAIYGEAVDGTDLVCNHAMWGDLIAYLDWSGLRPMTELEFEKACRGTVVPLADAYPWGTTGIATSAYTLANGGANNEGILTNYSTTLGNAYYGTTSSFTGGVLRVGIFAANGSNSGRVTAGAGYYGAMELGGSVVEEIVTIADATGRAYTGNHGNGSLASTGETDQAGWPLPGAAVGHGWRGGFTTATATYLRISDRGFAISPGTILRDNNQGGRGVRTP